MALKKVWVPELNTYITLDLGADGLSFDDVPRVISDASSNPIALVTTGGTTMARLGKRVASVAHRQSVHKTTEQASPGLDNMTHQRISAAPAPFVAMRVAFYNNGAAAASVGATLVAPTATIANTPSGGTGTFIQATAGGAVITNAAPLVLPSRLGVDRPSVTVTDWMPCISIDRTIDAYTSLHLGIARAYTALAPYSAIGPDASWESSTKTLGHIEISRRQSGDFCTSGQQNLATGVQNTVLLAMEVQFMLANGVTSRQIASIGDSISSWEAETAVFKYGTPEFLATAALSTSSAPIAWQNLGWGGETSAQYFLRALDYLTKTDQYGQYIHTLSVLIYAIGSPNDGPPTQAIVNSDLAQVAQILDICQRRRIALVLRTMIPQTTNSGNSASSWTMTADNFRKTLNSAAYTIATNNSGVFVLDYDTIVSNGASPALFANANLTVEGTHLTDAARQLLTAPATAAIRAAMAWVSEV